ncbi:MAG: hypothetical protein ACYDAY_08485 [Candidatus Dormibacteria bacterium]
MRRALVALAAVLVVVGFGFGVYWGLGHLRRVSAVVREKPSQTEALISLPGSLYLVQTGQIYRLVGRHFTQLTSGEPDWTQPAVSPDGTRLAAVLRRPKYSDIYLLDPQGHPTANITHDAAVHPAVIGENNWVFYPQFSPDGQSLTFSYDEPKVLGDYRVDLAIWQLNLADLKARWQELTTPNFYTGGDVRPSLLSNGDLVYSAFALDADSNVYSQVLLQHGNKTTALSPAKDDCGQSALSPGQNLVAMVCSYQNGRSDLVVATFDGEKLGPLVTLVSDQLSAGPVWAPDGSGIAYLAPAETGGNFQVWWAPYRAGTAPAHPQQVSQNLDLDGTSPLAWGG